MPTKLSSSVALLAVLIPTFSPAAAQISRLPTPQSTPQSDQPMARPAPANTAQPVPLPFPLPGQPNTRPAPPSPQPQYIPPQSANMEWQRIIRCTSSRNRTRECRADASGGAGLVRVLSGNCSRNNWGYRNDVVFVRNGCSAEIGVRSRNWSGNQGGNWGGNSGGNWGGNNGNWQIGRVRCESRNNRYQECRADARGGARISRVLGGNCNQQNWGYRNDMLWVNRGCRADFEVRGYGPQPDQGGGGPSAGVIIGGIAVAAGLAALLASRNKDKQPETSAQSSPAQSSPEMPAPENIKPALISINTSSVPLAARPAFQLCLDEAARQIGATGGTEIQLEDMQEIEPGNGGHRFTFRLKGIWPDEARSINSYCRATPTQLIQLDFS